ncbi:MAG: hypothetical protein AAGB24_13915 [Bacteroidota bacterium]
MKLLNLFPILVFTAISCSTEEEITNSREESTSNLEQESQKLLQVEGYTNYDLVGFNIFVEDKAFENDDALTQEALDLLERKLIEVTELDLSNTILNQLKTVNIFVDWKTSNGAAVFHPSEYWLAQNGYILEKTEAIEISNIQNFINWTNKNQPFLVLHELAHGYHHAMSANSEKRAAITEAYQNAISSELYKNVSYDLGNGNYSTAYEAYALTSEGEYFAELTEALFGQNDYFPFNKQDLENYDSEGFKALKMAWEQP